MRREGDEPADTPAKRRAFWGLKPLAEPETVEEVAEEALELLRAALEDGAVQRDSVRMVLGCHAAMVRLDRARAAEARGMLEEMRGLLEEARQPVPAAERERWRREFTEDARAALEEVKQAHRDGAEMAALSVRDEARRLVRAADNGAAWRAAGLLAASFVFGSLCSGVAVWSLCR